MWILAGFLQHRLTPFLIHVGEFAIVPCDAGVIDVSAARFRLVVDRFKSRFVEDAEARLSHAQAQVDIIIGDRQAFIEAADRFKSLPLHRHQGAGHSGRLARAAPTIHGASCARVCAEAFVNGSTLIDPHGYARVLNRKVRIEEPGASDPCCFIGQALTNDIVPSWAQKLEIIVGEDKYVVLASGCGKIVEAPPVEGLIQLHDLDVSVPNAFGKEVQGVYLGAAIVEDQYINRMRIC
ncbi:hypothetical protein D3C72_1158110 [compost metagenome]